VLHTINIASNWRLETFGRKEVLENNWYLFVELLRTRYNRKTEIKREENRGVVERKEEVGLRRLVNVWREKKYRRRKARNRR
jgi:hypothetical protein